MRLLAKELTDLPSSQGFRYEHAPLSDAGGLVITGLVRDNTVAFRLYENVGIHSIGNFGAQSRGLLVRCLRLAANVAVGLAQDSLPGGDQFLARVGFAPTGNRCAVSVK